VRQLRRTLRSAKASGLAAALAAILLGAPGLSRAQGDSTGDSPALAAIHFYQRHLSSLRYGRCAFAPSCSEYAAQAIHTYGLLEGSALAADRLVRCNATAAQFYSRDESGRLADPVSPGLPPVAGLRVPAWMISAGWPPSAPPASPPESARFAETLAFANHLEQLGDCWRASTEFQRAASLAGGAATESWAFARSGACFFALGDWGTAASAWLSAATLATDPGERAEALWMTSAARFNAGDFRATERLLENGPQALAPTAAAAADSSLPSGGPGLGARALALGGLCLMERGDWAQAQARFRRASGTEPDSRRRERIARMAHEAERGPDLPGRSPGLATTLSVVVPGSGQFYSGRPADGLRHLIVNGLLIATIVHLARNEEVPAAVLVGAVALPFYVGNVMGAGRSARQFNRGQRLDLVERTIASSER
jgi:putative membrane protein insertion efficiency factor